MKCTICRKRIPIAPIYVKLNTGKQVGACCEPCAERVASGKIKMPATNKQKAA